LRKLARILLPLLALCAGTLSAQIGNPIHGSVLFPQELPLTTAATAQTYATSAVVADFDGDGRPDVAVSSEFPSKIAWYRNNGDGTFGAPLTVSAGLGGPHCIFAADLDNDGRVDIAAADYLYNQIAWIRNVGGPLASGLFGYNTADPYANLRLVSAAVSRPLCVAAADLNNDGLTDLLSTSATDNKVAWYRNLGSGSFASQTVISTAGAAPSSVLGTDLDGDGIRDLVVTSGNDDTLAWFKGSIVAGNPQFTRYVIATDQTRTQAANIADFDSDGRADVVCAATYGNKITWFRNLTAVGGSLAPYFGSGQIVSGNAAGVFSVAAPDLNRDSRPDIVGALFNGSKVTWYSNVSGGNFGWNPSVPAQNQYIVAPAVYEAVAVATGDFNQDGTADVVSAASGDGKVAVYINQGGQCAFATANTAPAGIVEGRKDDLLRIAVSNRGIAGDNNAKLDSLTLHFEKSSGVAMTTAEANALIDYLQFYVDADNSMSFDANIDTLVATLNDLSLSSGRLAFPLASAAPVNVQIQPGATRNYFVVARMAAGSSALGANACRVTHISQGAGASVAKDAVSSAVLSIEAAGNSNIASSIVVAQPPQTYLDWSFLSFDTSGPAGTGPLESLFADGVPNLMKYAFAINPVAGGANSGLPKMVSVGTSKVFHHFRTTWATDVSYAYEISHDMLSWAPAVNGVDYTRTDTPIGNGVTQTELAILGGWPKSFLRVRLELAN
jgi:hypothetical protein